MLVTLDCIDGVGRAGIAAGEAVTSEEVTFVVLPGGTDSDLCWLSYATR